MSQKVDCHHYLVVSAASHHQQEYIHPLRYASLKKKDYLQLKVFSVRIRLFNFTDQLQISLLVKRNGKPSYFAQR